MRLIKFSDIDIEPLAIYSKLTEAQLRRAGGGEGYFIAESLNVIAAALESGYEPVSMLTEERHIDRISSFFNGSDLDIPVYTSDPAVLEGLTGYRMHRGILAAFSRKPLPCIEEVLVNASRIAVLEGLNDPTNVGSIFRSAAALGMDAVLVSSSTCDPLHRRSVRVSMGSVFRIPWTVLPCLASNKRSADIGILHSYEFKTCALALNDNSITIDDEKLLECDKLALLIGSEGDGLSAETISASDFSAKIPMYHGVDSLNAAAASAVAFWVLSRGRDNIIQFSVCS